MHLLHSSLAKLILLILTHKFKDTHMLGVTTVMGAGMYHVDKLWNMLDKLWNKVE